MSTKTKIELKTPTKKREEFEIVGAVRLFKAKDMKPQDAWGITIRPLLSDGKEDFGADAYLIWFTAIDTLKTGGAVSMNVFKVPYKPKPEA